jgi:hypothetical protein
MKSKASLDKTVICVDMNIKPIEWAKELGLDLSKLANQLLKTEVKKRLRKIKAGLATSAIPT